MENDENQKSTGSSGEPGLQEQEKFLLRTSKEVIRLLKSLSDKPDIITAKISGSDHSMMTAVLDVFPQKSLVVLDYGPNEALNKKMLAAEKIVFTTRHDMVETRFSCGELQRVKFKGEPAFAAPIPTSVLYLQRREYFRIKPLISHPVYCELNREDQVSGKLEVLDICIRGLSLHDEGDQWNLSEGDRLNGCKLILPANPNLTVNLEIQYTTTIVGKDNETTNRVGGKFTNLNQNEEFTLQRFINMVQLEQHAKS